MNSKSAGTQNCKQQVCLFTHKQTHLRKKFGHESKVLVITTPHLPDSNCHVLARERTTVFIW